MCTSFRPNRFVLPAIIALSAASARAQSQAPIAPAGPEIPAIPPREVLLRAGEKLTLRIRQVIPPDELSPGDRMLNSLPALAKGDRILAEVVAPGPPALVGGVVLCIEPPRRFGKPGKVTLQLGQLVTFGNGRSEPVPWIFDLEDKRFNTRMKRKILLALFAAEGAGVGASIGSQLTGASNPLFIGGGAGVGLLSGVGYASLMRGREATLEPGDTFQVQVGTLSYRPVPPSSPLTTNPAQDPARTAKGRHRP
ncbi:MAG: hypothetical protein P4L84_37690 [Isosphaeraceae bacterium]|nr:hypothetical protein [Isosphaeraceae bacterium]